MADDPSKNPEFTGVQLGSFRNLTGQMSSAASQLEQLSHALWSELNKLGISTAPAMKIQAIAQWAQKKSPELQQRYQLAQQWNKSGSAALSGPYTKIDETKIGDAAKKTKDGQAAAPLAKLAAKGDEKALNELISKYGHEAKNPYFATALMNALHAKELVELPAAMARHLFKLNKGGGGGGLKQAVQDNSILLKLLNTSLATATDPKNDVHVSQEFVDSLKEQGKALHKDSDGVGYYGYWGLGQILSASHSHTPYDESLKSVPFSTEFLKDVGGAMIDWDRTRTKPFRSLGTHDQTKALRPSAAFASGPFAQDSTIPYILNQPGVYPPSKRISSADPLSGLAEAASTSRMGAQELLDYPPNSKSKSNLSYLLHDRRALWGVGDHGDALGHMLEAAEKGHDERSQRLAVWTTWIRANDLESDFGVQGKQLTISHKDTLDTLSGMRDSEANILASHIDDVIDSLGTPGGIERVRTGDALDLGKGGIKKPHFGTRDLDRILVDLGLDDNAYQTLINAQAGHMRSTIDQAINSGATDLKGLTGKEASALAHIVQARGQGLLADGRLEDKAAQMQHDALANAVKMGVGFVPIPGTAGLKDLAGDKIAGFYNQIAAMGYDKLSSQLAGQAKSGAEDKALTATTSDEIAASNLIHQMIQSSILDHGAFKHTDLKDQPFTSDGKVDPKLATEEHRYSAFRDWLEGHSHVLDLEQHGDTTYNSGHTAFNLNLGLPRDA